MRRRTTDGRGGLRAAPSRRSTGRAHPICSGSGAAVVLLFLAALLPACSSIDVDTTIDQGLEAMDSGDIEAAETSFLAVLEEEPENVYALFNMGLIEAERARVDLAEGYYRSAVEQDPSYVPALYNLALLRAEKGDAVEAADLYRKVIFLEPTHAEAHLNLGLLLLEDAQTDAAAAQFEEALALDPSLASRLPKGDDDASSG